MTLSYKPPTVTTDPVVLSADCPAGLMVLTIKRGHEPFQGERTLPGVYVREGETIVNATERALWLKAGMDQQLWRPPFWAILGAFDSTGRDPRGHAISIPTLSIVSHHPWPHGGEWWQVNDRLDLAFDHNEIVDAAVNRVRDEMWHNPKMLTALLGSMTPTTSAFTTLNRVVRGEDPGPSNIRRRLERAGFVPTDAATPEGRGRPSKVWALPG